MELSENYIGDRVGHASSTHLMLLRYARSSFHHPFSLYSGIRKNKHALIVYDGLALEQHFSLSQRRHYSCGAHTIQKHGAGRGGAFTDTT